MINESKNYLNPRGRINLWVRKVNEIWNNLLGKKVCSQRTTNIHWELGRINFTDSPKFRFSEIQILRKSHNVFHKNFEQIFYASKFVPYQGDQEYFYCFDHKPTNLTQVISRLIFIFGESAQCATFETQNCRVVLEWIHQHDPFS